MIHAKVECLLLNVHVQLEEFLVLQASYASYIETLVCWSFYCRPIRR